MSDKLSYIDVFASGHVEFNGHRYPCALGPGGIKVQKTEGDGVTPAGIFPLRRVFYRPERVPPPPCGLPLHALRASDGWCDDPNHEKYNQLITLPFEGGHEKLWREDHVYDIIVELGYNDDPPVPGRGSAIFMHIARAGYAPTQGCVALNIENLLTVLTACDPGTRVRINL